jgi:hypothetical protein
MGRRTHCVWLLVLASPLAAQERRACPGRVVDAAGKPVAGAEVVLLFAPAFAAELGGVDVVRTQSDAQGRFRAELLDGAGYRAWASTATDASTSVAVVPGRQCELRLAAARKQAVVGGLEAWHARAPFRLRLFVAGTPLPVPEVPLVDGRAALPALPFDGVCAELLDKDGEVVTTVGGDRSELSESIWPPQPVRVRVVDAAGAPLPGVDIAQCDSQYVCDDGLCGTRIVPRRWHRGTTGADGKVELQVPFPVDPFTAAQRPGSLHFLASKAGFAAGLAGFAPAPYADGQPLDPAARELRLVLRAQEPRTARILGAPAGASVVLGMTAIARTGLTVDLAFACQPAADGAIALPVLSTKTCIDRVMTPPLPLPDGASADALAGVRRARTREPLVIALDGALVAGDTIDLRGNALLQIEVRDGDGEPVAGLQVVGSRRGLAGYLAGDGSGEGFCPLLGRTDLQGRLALAAPRGRWFLFTAGERGFAHAEFELGDAPSSPIALSVTPYATQALQVVDRDGRPVAGATPLVVYTEVAATRDPFTVLALHALRATDWLCEHRASGADGALLLPFVPTAHYVRRVAVCRDDAEGANQSEAVLLAPNTTPARIVVQ